MLKEASHTCLILVSNLLFDSMRVQKLSGCHIVKYYQKFDFSKVFAGIKFRGFEKSENFAGTNFHGFEEKPPKVWKLIPAKISTIKEAPIISARPYRTKLSQTKVTNFFQSD